MTNKHAPLEAQWTTFVEYMREQGIDVEAVDAELKAFTRRRTHRLAAAYRRRYQRQETAKGGTHG